MFVLTPIKDVKHWTDSKGQKFELLAVYNPNEEHDPWAKYVNKETGEEYTCRLEAFRARFTPIMD